LGVLDEKDRQHPVGVLAAQFWPGGERSVRTPGEFAIEAGRRAGPLGLDTKVQWKPAAADVTLGVARSASAAGETAAAPTPGS